LTTIDGNPAIFAQMHEGFRITQELNSLRTTDMAVVRQKFSELTGIVVDDSFVLWLPFYTNYGCNMRFGRHVFINFCCYFLDIGGITIGDDVMIAPKVNLVTGGHPLAPSERGHGITCEPIVIGNNVWLGTAVTVLAGVTIGDNSVVGAGSVVTHDVEPNSLVAGNPARTVRSLA